MMLRSLILCSVLVIGGISVAQSPFGIHLEPVAIPNLGGVQSYAFGQYNGKWLIVGGRLDGLHRRQPWASFDIAGHNNELIVVDPVSEQQWSAPLTSLPASVQEQLSSTNMEFYQNGDQLYVIGGYGYSNIAGDHITHPNLTAINVDAVIDSIIAGNGFASVIRQITDPEFAVTGGSLELLYGTYYLVGGQRFDGRYNPMGMPTFTQQYTEAVRRFELTDNGTSIVVNHLSPYTDAQNLHRRDLNVVPQIMPNGEEAVTIFSGVFQTAADIPYLTSVDIDTNGHTLNSSFSQYYNHYHCATAPLFSSTSNEMHTVFFGGIAQYYDSSGVLVQDNDVPFVRSIARVTRDSNGQMSEFLLPTEMPALLGASSEFIPLDGVAMYTNNVLDLDSFTADTTHIGYIYGGIESSAPNIFWVNDGTQSSAYSGLFKVYLTKGANAVDDLNAQSNSPLRVQLYPYPYDNILLVRVHMDYTSEVSMELHDMQGRLVYSSGYGAERFGKGESEIYLRIGEIAPNTTYIFTLRTDRHSISQKLISNQ